MLNKSLMKRTVPPLPKFNSVEEWQTYRKSLKELFLKEEYGDIDCDLTPSVKIEPQGVDFAGKAKWESVFFTFENKGKSHTVRAELILPKGKDNVPVFVNIGFAREVPNKYLPVEEIIDTGFGVFYFCYENVTEDNKDFESGLSGLLDRKENGGFGKIRLWAFMASKCMDYLEGRKEVDINNVAVIGHSRLGKTAILASALDERFILTCSNDSGCCGAAISRGKIKENESIEDIVRVFPFWFCDSFKEYKGNEDKLPFDQHMLLSLIAPRYLMVGGALEDVWADNEGQLLSCQLCSPIWRLYGKNGLINEGYELGDYSEGEVCFHLRAGTHFHSRDDWKIYMKKFREIIKRGSYEI